MALLFVPINSTRRESSSPASTGSSESESEEQEAEEDYQPVVVATDTNHFHLRDQSRVEYRPKNYTQLVNNSSSYVDEEHECVLVTYTSTPAGINKHK